MLNFLGEEFGGAVVFLPLCRVGPSCVSKRRNSQSCKARRTHRLPKSESKATNAKQARRKRPPLAVDNRALLRTIPTTASSCWSLLHLTELILPSTRTNERTNEPNNTMQQRFLFQPTTPARPHLFFFRSSTSSYSAWWSLLLLCTTMILLLMSNNSNTVSAQTCDLQCPTDIGATCAFGNSPHTVQGTTTTTNNNNGEQQQQQQQQEEVSINGMHCSCPPGYTGLYCEVAFESCGDGDGSQHVCYHGGSCVSGEVDDFGNVQLYCDCSTAALDGSGNVQQYVGKYCQHATVSAETETCDASTNEASFCFNQGVCNPQYP